MRATLTTAVCALLLTIVGEPALADSVQRDPRELRLLRLELDNYTFLGSDDAFTAGWSFHSPLLDEWPPSLARWVGDVPGLGDDGAGKRVVRSAAGLTQLIITPENIQVARAQPRDVPWAGMLGGYVSGRPTTTTG